MSAGLLVLRVVVGLLFVGHGTQKLFGWFGGSGISGFARLLESRGYRPARAMAVLTGLSESGGGLLFAAGFLTPLAAAALIGVMVNAILAVHARRGVWNSNGGIEFPLTNAAAATAVAFTGPGRLSIDHAIALAPDHVRAGVFALALGLVAGLAVFATRATRPAGASGVPGGATAA
ncbi:MAG TPA: DoxX family protein [Actinomycetota bacterium]|nr:DoxX family protein [Actinomycetota bacterium]